jgi:hypothetical protein
LGHAVGADVAERDEPYAVDKLHLHSDERIDHPQIQVLPPMVPSPLLMRRQPGDPAGIDVRVEPGDIDVFVMNDGVLPSPGVRTAADQVHRHRHQPIEPLALGI